MKVSKKESDKLRKLIEANPVASGLPDEVMDIVLYKAKELQDKGVFDPIMVDTLVIYASNIHQLAKIDAELTRDGQTIRYTDRYGAERTAPHPLVKARKDLVGEIRHTGKLFGFSPLDSQSIKPKRSRALEEFKARYGG